MTSKKDAFVSGGFLGILGLYALAFLHSLDTGFFLLGLGVVLMASTSKEFREKLFDFFLLVLKGLLNFVSNLL